MLRVKYRIRLVQIVFPEALVERQQQCSASGTYLHVGNKVACGKHENFEFEQWSRRTVNKAILEEIIALNSTLNKQHDGASVDGPSLLSEGDPPLVPGELPLTSARALRKELFVYFSDVDELLDSRVLFNHSHRFGGCMGVRQKVFMYNERCFMKGTR